MSPAAENEPRDTSPLPYLGLDSGGPLGGLDGVTNCDRGEGPIVLRICDAAEEAVIMYRRSGSGTGRGRVRTALDVAASRATGRVRRLIVGNRLDRFVTLTVANAALAFADVVKGWRTATIRQLRTAEGWFPWLVVPHFGVKSGRPHLHVCTTEPAVSSLVESWSFGAADVRELDALEDRRRCAQYLAVRFDHAERPTQRRYYRSSGLAVTVRELSFGSWAEAAAYASDVFCSPPTSTKRFEGDLGTPLIEFLEFGGQIDSEN